MRGKCWKEWFLEINLQELQVCLQHRFTRKHPDIYDANNNCRPALVCAALTEAQVSTTEHSRKHSLPPTNEPSAKRSKKGKKAKTGSKAAIPELNPSDYVRVVKVTNRDDLLHEGPVLLSKSDKANQMTLSDDRLTVTSSKGYRMVS